MEDYYYIPVEKEGDEFTQKETLDIDDIHEYKISNYKAVIDKYFDEIDAIVRLKTGKYHTKVYKSKDDSDNLYFCLVNRNNFPNDQNEISLNDEIAKNVIKNLSIKASYSEGMYSSQVVDILSNFVTPRVKFLNSHKEEYYNPTSFIGDFLIFGEPGSGKTTLLRRITLDFLYNSFEVDNKLRKLPIYIQLRDYNHSPIDFESFIEQSIENSFSSINLLETNSLSTTGNLCLMLDGADEVDFEKFKNFKSTISTYKRKHPLVSFIITSRPDRSFESMEHFNICYVQPFNKSQIKELTFRNFGKDYKWKDYISILNSVPEVYDVLKNPLLLTISHFLYLHKSIIPLNTGQLIKELVAALVNNWDAQRDIERKLDNKKVSPIEVTNFLGKMALALSEKKSSSISLDELHGLFDGFDSKIELEKFLEFIDFSTGLIKKEGGLSWRFTHKSIQDFLCSNYLVESLGALDKKIFIDKDWDTISLMISGLSSDPNYIINSMLHEGKRSEFERIRNSLLCFGESHILSKGDIKRSYELVEKFVLNYEEQNGITPEQIQIGENRIVLYDLVKTKGFDEIVAIILTLFRIRFTKYEYNFYGYINSSESRLMKSIARLHQGKGNISVITEGPNAVLVHEAESPDIVED